MYTPSIPTYYTVKIKPLDDKGHCEVYINDIRMKGVKRIATLQRVDSLPQVGMTFYPSEVDVEALSKLHLLVDVDDLRSAICCIQLALKLDDDFRNAMKAGIDSVLRDYGINTTEPSLGRPDISDAVMEVVFDAETWTA